MALGSDESPVPQSSVATSCKPEDFSTSSRASTQQSEAGIQGLKTIHILKEWPLVTGTVNKARQLYESLKTKSRILNWSCAVAEKSVYAVYQGSTRILPVFYPAVRVADFAASEVAEAVQQQLPIVRQPPSQVSEAVKSGFRGLFGPLIDKIESVVNNGKRRTRSAVKTVIGMYKKLIVAVDKWMDEMEKYIETLKHKGVKAAPTSESESSQAGSRRLKRKALDVVATAALFYVGASFWLLSRLPVIGGYLQQISSPASSKSPSPVRQPEPQSSHPLSESTAAAAAAAETTEEQLVSQVVPEVQSATEANVEK